MFFTDRSSVPEGMNRDQMQTALADLSRRYAAAAVERRFTQEQIKTIEFIRVMYPLCMSGNMQIETIGSFMLDRDSRVEEMIRDEVARKNPPKTIAELVARLTDMIETAIATPRAKP